MRVTVAATAIAKASRLGGEPETTSFWTSIGWAIEASKGCAWSRFWAARRANWITSSRSALSELLAGSSERTASRMCWLFRRPRMSRVCPRRLKVPPRVSRVR
jgi:hypothetical protein